MCEDVKDDSMKMTDDSGKPSNDNSLLSAKVSSTEIVNQKTDLYMREFDQYKITAAQIFDAAVMRALELPNGSIKRTNDNPALLNYDIKLLK